MALVAYDNSDSSEYEDENESIQTKVKHTDDLSTEDTVTISGEQDSDESPNLFIQLPQPSRMKKMVLEEDDEFLKKKESTADAKPKSRITIPSLNDFKDVDVTIPSSKTRANNGKKSGLLGILPQPKNELIITRPLIPNIIAQKPHATTAKKKATLAPAKISQADTKGLGKAYSDESDTDDVQNDFFSINKPDNLPVEDLPFNPGKTDDKVKKQPRSIESYFKKDIIHVEAQPDVEPGDNEVDCDNAQIPESIDIVATQSNEAIVLDDEAILKLCGTRGKRKREEIQIVDINQQEVLNEARQLLLKGLMEDTSKRQSSSKKRGHEPTSQQRRKHQITYLAHQAKANEADLQNQWAHNRMMKKKSQSKYGF